MGRIKVDERTRRAMRKAGRLGAKRRWRGTTPEERAATMRAVRAASAEKQRAAKALRDMPMANTSQPDDFSS